MKRNWKHPLEADAFDEYWDEYYGDGGPDPDFNPNPMVTWLEMKEDMRQAFNAGSHYGRAWGPYQEFNPFE